MYSAVVFAGGCRSGSQTCGVCGGHEKLLDTLAGWWMGEGEGEGVTIGVVEEVARANEVDWKWFLRGDRGCHCVLVAVCSAWDKDSLGIIRISFFIP